MVTLLGSTRNVFDNTVNKPEEKMMKGEDKLVSPELAAKLAKILRGLQVVHNGGGDIVPGLEECLALIEEEIAKGDD